MLSKLKTFWATFIFGLVVILAPLYLGITGQLTEGPSVAFYIFGGIIIIVAFKMLLKKKKRNGR